MQPHAADAAACSQHEGQRAGLSLGWRNSWACTQGATAEATLAVLAPAGAQQRSTETSADTRLAALVQALSGGPFTRAFAGQTDTTGGANCRVEVRKAPK